MFGCDSCAVVSGAVLVSVCLCAAWAYLWCKARPVTKQYAATEVAADRVCKQGFTAKKVPENLDAIVIGSGMGGLTTAALLAREGKKVLVLEQHTMAGGNTHTFEEHGYEFDTGLHYIGGKVGQKNSPARKLWDYVTDSGVEWARMEDFYDRAVLRSPSNPRGRVEYPMHSDIKKLIADLHARFPDDTEAIDKYFRLVRKANNAFGLYVLTKVLPTWVSRLLRWKFPKAFALFDLTMKDVLDDLTTNDTLKGVLAYSYGDFGEPPNRSAFVMNAIVVSHYNGGAYYPVGGPAVIPHHMVRVIERYGGGRVLVRAPVTSLVVEDGKVAGVVVKGKHTIRAPLVVSSIGAPQTFNHLVPEDLRAKLFQPEIKSLQHPDVASAMSLMSMFVGIKGTVEDLQLPLCNHWVFPSWDHDRNVAEYRADPAGAPLPAVFMSFSSAKDPSYAARYPNRQTALVIGPSFYEHVEKFKDLRVGKRGEEYETLKKVWEDKLMHALLLEFPQLEGHIDFVELGTAVTNNFYLGNFRGAVYGLSHTPERFRQPYLTPKTKLPGLWLTGQDSLTSGISGAQVSGLVTAAALVPSFALRRAWKFV
eukprot:INCI15239.1.p1 GENE.INCI15239.1~~INCI15239.1.p1  ORF type:complete len:590 (-),score=97.29 INCI15239.1:554-2323(-)